MNYLKKMKKLKTIKIKIKEIPFSELSSFDEEGKKIPFDIGDKGEFIEDLYSEIDFEILINDLPTKIKEAFRLRGKEGLSNSEIAKRTNSKTRAIEQLIRRGNEKIRTKIKRIQKNQLKKFGQKYE